jgi:hypothetical protein
VIAKNPIAHFLVMGVLLAPIAWQDRIAPLRSTRSGTWAAAMTRATRIAPASDRVRFAIWFVEKDRPHAAHEAAEIARIVTAGGADAARGRGDRSPVPQHLFWNEESLARAAGPDVAHAAMRAAPFEVVGPMAAAWGFYVLVPLERGAAVARSAP